MKNDDPFTDRVRVRSSALILQEDTILLVKQRVPTRKHPVWLPPGGAVMLGETSHESMEREVYEETNLKVPKGRLRYIHEFIESPYHAVELYYVVKKISGELKTGSDPELDYERQQILEAKFISLYDINRLNLYPQFLKREITSNNILMSGIKHF